MLHFLGWGVRWTVATVFFLAVMAGAGYWVFLQALSGGEHVSVPDVVGLNLPDASLKLAQSNLEIGSNTFVAHESYERGTVLAQRPSPDKIVKAGRKVSLTISMGAGFLEAPNLLKKDWQAAREELINSQFQEGHVARIPHTAKRDTVLAQDPLPGTTITNDFTVNVLLSAGDATSTNVMPDLIGKTREEVDTLLKGYGVSIEFVEAPDLEGEPNVVLQQEPKPDENVYSGQKVRIWIKAPEKTEAKTFTAQVVHRWDADWYQKSIRVQSVDRNGKVSVVATFNPVAADHPDARDRMAGYGRNFEVKYTEKAMLEIFEDGQKVATYHMKNGAPPIMAPR